MTDTPDDAEARAYAGQPKPCSEWETDGLASVVKMNATEHPIAQVGEAMQALADRARALEASKRETDARCRTLEGDNFVRAAENAALRADSARLDWLLEHSNAEHDVYNPRWIEKREEKWVWSPWSSREQIDAAMQAAKEGT